MRVFRISEPLKAAFKKQRQTVFGNKRYWLHIATWLVVGVIIGFGETADSFAGGFVAGSTSAGGTEKEVRILSNLSWVTTTYGVVFGVLLAAFMIYFFLLIVIPIARHRRKRRVLWLGLATNVAIFCLMVIATGIIAGYTGVKDKLAGQQWLAILGFVMIVAVSLSSYFFAIYYFIDLYDQQKKLKQYEEVLKAKLEAESNFLKMQINPHFLFNTLNNIYSLALSKSTHAAVTSQRLKELLEYMLHDCAKDKVSLSGELEFIKNYIALEQLRNKEDDIDIQLYISGNAADTTIAPLLLINFIENAFKHGVKAGIEKAYVHINISTGNGRLHMNITNSKPPATEVKMAVKESGGIGIKNVQRRLEMLYPLKHKLRLSKSRESYTVDLKIDL